METNSKIYKKLLDFQSKVESIKKDGKNTFFKNAKGQASAYATLPNILAEVKPILNELKLILLQPISNGFVSTIILDVESSEKIESSIVLPLNLNAQQTGSCITYYRRYTLSSLLSLEIDEDDDGNKASNQNETKKNEVIWLKQDEFDKAMASTKKGILAVLNVYNGTSGKQMKKEYLDKLTKQLEIAPNEGI